MTGTYIAIVIFIGLVSIVSLIVAPLVRPLGGGNRRKQRIRGD